MSQQLRILVVEDEDGVTAVTYKPLEKYYLENVEFAYATTGEAAVDLLQAHEFDVMLLDLDLTKGKKPMTGRQLLTWTAKHAPGTYVVIVTGTQTQGIERDGTKKRFEGYEVREIVGKPISLAKLEQLLEAIRVEKGKG